MMDNKIADHGPRSERTPEQWVGIDKHKANKIKEPKSKLSMSHAVSSSLHDANLGQNE